MYRYEALMPGAGGSLRTTRSTERTDVGWSDERIERDLRQFCSGRNQWPTEAEFKAAGLRKLYCAASNHGGVDSWKRRLGAPFDPDAFDTR
jgi:hypothetical protein